MSNEASGSRLSGNNPFAVVRYHETQAGGGYRPCDCRLPPKLRTSWTPKHPVRQFLNCPMSLKSTKSCKYFDWVDPEVQPEYECYKKQLYDLHVKLNKKADYAQIAKLEEKVGMLKCKRACEKEKMDAFILEMGTAKAETKRVKKELFWTRAVVVAFVVFLIAWFVSTH